MVLSITRMWEIRASTYAPFQMYSSHTHTRCLACEHVQAHFHSHTLYLSHTCWVCDILACSGQREGIFKITFQGSLKLQSYKRLRVKPPGAVLPQCLKREIKLSAEETPSSDNCRYKRSRSQFPEGEEEGGTVYYYGKLSKKWFIISCSRSSYSKELETWHKTITWTVNTKHSVIWLDLFSFIMSYVTSVSSPTKLFVCCSDLSIVWC